MGDSAMVVVAIFLAAILMFVFPLMTTADKKDDISTLSAQTAVTQFTDNIIKTGQLTSAQLDNLQQTLAATGNSFNVDIKIYVLDENPSKKETSNTKTIGENVYYIMYMTQIQDALNSGTLSLKEGDLVYVEVKNTNVTMGTQLRNFWFRITGRGDNLASIVASDSGMVTVNGK